MTQAKEKEKAPSRNQCVNETLKDDWELCRERWAERSFHMEELCGGLMVGNKG